jgi:uncharacterized protein (DUF4415 family)
MLKRKAPKMINENPEWSAADFKNVVRLDGVSMADAVKAIRRGRGPQKEAKKVAISIRLNPDIVKHFKSGGAGWQSRMEAVLKKASGGRKGLR